MAKDLGKVEQSPADDRSYRALELENGLQASAKGSGAGGDWGWLARCVCMNCGLSWCFIAGTFCEDRIDIAGGPSFRGRL